jgi:hypothetical protein
MSLVAARAAASIVSRRMPCCPLRPLFITFSRRHSIDGHHRSHLVPPSFSSLAPHFMLCLSTGIPHRRGASSAVFTHGTLDRRWASVRSGAAVSTLARPQARAQNDGVHPSISSETSLLSWCREKLHGRAGRLLSCSCARQGCCGIGSRVLVPDAATGPLRQQLLCTVRYLHGTGRCA